MYAVIKFSGTAAERETRHILAEAQQKKEEQEKEVRGRAYEYQNLYKLRPHLPKVPFVALTATATHREFHGGPSPPPTPTVDLSFVSRWKLGDYFTAFNRRSDFREELGRAVLNDIGGGGSTLIYCTTVKDVEEVKTHW
ncbi:unnamed protein product [Calypogeia fissa]